VEWPKMPFGGGSMIDLSVIAEYIRTELQEKLVNDEIQENRLPEYFPNAQVINYGSTNENCYLSMVFPLHESTFLENTNVTVKKLQEYDNLQALASWTCTLNESGAFFNGILGRFLLL
jgi:hypothetical protein